MKANVPDLLIATKLQLIGWMQSTRSYACFDSFSVNMSFLAKLTLTPTDASFQTAQAGTAFDAQRNAINAQFNVLLAEFNHPTLPAIG
ncbi:hypothetical protein [Pseudomonas putida]|uniref:hypothetical protein n=1 Tax=Pseudomonas putida TaxID=303 RepID=UPI001E474527|nr:hypothetical protein [Pseudomonas putida]MCE0970268.1 hypothetical protein [Pseudomonas putida]